MSQQQLNFRVPDIKFRVLIVGRANAGKTSILQRVCETTESPKIYRVTNGTREEIHLNPTAERGDHNIEDELIFTNHDGYVFHDSCGFEAGNEDELRIVQDFVRKKATARRLQDRLHAIWYCIPMQNNRPSLDMKFFGAICPDKNVPVIAVFTKYDQFKRDIRMKLGARSPRPAKKDVTDEAEKIFQEQYWNVIKGESPRHVRLECMHKPGESCDALITETAHALSIEVVSLMLLAVQQGNLEMSVKLAVQRTTLNDDAMSIIKSSIAYFPFLWAWVGSLALMEK
jgi:GTP-binding protein EngB required for normal cell division